MQRWCCSIQRLQTVWAQGQEALTGTVSSEAEGNMEGVVVTAKRPGSIVEVSVTTDAQGRYVFPENRLDPGEYALSIRAVGYDIGAPTKAKVEPEKTATADIKLKKAKNLASQLTNAEWMMSIPGTDDQKATLLNCQGCHTLERIMRSTHDSDEWTQVITRMMGYGAVSQPIKPQRMLDPNRQGQPEQYRKMADYLATINLSSSDHWSYELKTLPRPKGRDTRAIVTQYDMVRPTTEPHDILVDKDGMVWYTDFGEMFIGKFDPKTLKLTEYPIKKFKDKAPTGLLSIEFDHTGKIWFDTMYQGSLGSLDPKTGEIAYYPLPPEYNDDRVQLNFTGLRYDVDGKVWTKSVGTQDIFRLDLATNTWERFHPTDQLPPNLKHAGIYQVMAELQEQPVDGRIHRRPSRQARCEDQGSDVVRHADPESAGAPHADRRPGPHPGDRISDQQGRAVRHQDGKIPRRIQPAAVDVPVPSQLRQERRALGLDDEHRPRRAARSQDRQVGAIPDAVRHQHAHGVRRQFDDAGDVLGRQQPRSSDRESGAARLGRQRSGVRVRVFAPRPKNRTGRAARQAEPLAALGLTAGSNLVG